MKSSAIKMAILLSLALMSGVLGAIWLDWQEAQDRYENAASLSQRP